MAQQLALATETKDVGIHLTVAQVAMLGLAGACEVQGPSRLTRLFSRVPQLETDVVGLAVIARAMATCRDWFFKDARFTLAASRRASCRDWMPVHDTIGAELDQLLTAFQIQLTLVQCVRRGYLTPSRMSSREATEVAMRLAEACWNKEWNDGISMHLTNRQSVLDEVGLGVPRQIIDMLVVRVVGQAVEPDDRTTAAICGARLRIGHEYSIAVAVGDRAHARRLPAGDVLDPLVTALEAIRPGRER